MGKTANTNILGFVEIPWRNKELKDIKHNIYMKTAIHRFETVEELVDSFGVFFYYPFVNRSQIEVNGGYFYK